MAPGWGAQIPHSSRIVCGQDSSVSGRETYRFTGKPYSQATGLYYEYQRWYDPSIGRFISPDPYVYVGNRPTSLVDLSLAKNQLLS